MLEWMYTISFYALSLMLIMGALGVLFLRNVFHAGLSLMFTLFMMAGMFILLGAEFVAGVQVLVYVGAIAVLIMFAIMLTHRIGDKTIKQYTRALFPGAIIGIGLIVVAFLTIGKMNGLEFSQYSTYDMIPKIGELLLTQYVLPFEVISILLLGSLIGAIVLVSKSKNDSDKKKEDK